MCRSCERESVIDTEPEWIPLSPKGRGETASKHLESQVSIGVETFVVAPLEATLSSSHSELFTNVYSVSNSAASPASHTSGISSIHSHNRSIVLVCVNTASEGDRAAAIMC